MRDFAAQGAVFAGLMQTLREGTFVHAYLISGMRGVGKHTLARLMAQYILCRGDKGDEPCGVCPSCVRMLDGTHPDVVRLLPEKDKKSIVVDQVRELVALAGEHTYEGGRRILLIEQAEKMNPQAQNALLKTLEEPRRRTYSCCCARTRPCCCRRSCPAAGASSCIRGRTRWS